MNKKYKALKTFTGPNGKYEVGKEYFMTEEQARGFGERLQEIVEAPKSEPKASKKVVEEYNDKMLDEETPKAKRK